MMARPLAGRRNRGYLLGDPYRGRDARVGRYTSVTASRMTDAYGASTPPRCTAGWDAGKSSSGGTPVHPAECFTKPGISDHYYRV